MLPRRRPLTSAAIVTIVRRTLAARLKPRPSDSNTWISPRQPLTRPHPPLVNIHIRVLVHCSKKTFSPQNTGAPSHLLLPHLPSTHKQAPPPTAAAMAAKRSEVSRQLVHLLSPSSPLVSENLKVREFVHFTRALHLAIIFN